jgi:hypothetical protein
MSSNIEIYLDGILQKSDVVLLPSDGWKQIVYVGKGTAATSYEYNGAMHRIYMTKNATALMALPFLFPGQYIPRPGEIIGRVASLEAWR